jgi:signal transduction histidine kinase
VIKLQGLRSTHLALASAILILLAIGTLAYRGLDAAQRANGWVAHTHDVLDNLQRLSLAVVSIEASDRRYMLTDDNADLSASRASLTSAYAYLDQVRRLTVDNPVQQVRAPALRTLLDAKRQRLEVLPKLLASGGLAALIPIVKVGNGDRLHLRTLAAAEQMQDEERRLLAIRVSQATRESGEAKLALIFGTPLALLITAGASWTAVRDGARRERAEADLLHKVDELKRSNEELGNFAYVASHDLQEPLRMVTSYLQLLSRRYRGKFDAEADEFIDFAVDGATRMRLLIQDLLAYSRVGTVDAPLVDTSSQEALKLALNNLKSTIAESGALVTYDPLPKVLAIETQLTQLFQNLVGNAVKYQNTGTPKIHVSARRIEGKKWLFAVKDNGLGIEPQYFEKIFGMFQRLHGREEFSGTGIGLAICKKIVERHGGTISVESQAGEGSTFRFALAGTE